MNLFMYAHGGSGNHGCEAIVRSTVNILQDNCFDLYSYRQNEDCYYGVDSICNILDEKCVRTNRFSIDFIIAYLKLKLKGDYMPLNRIHELNMLSLVSENAIALSIGGDNYCYAGASRIMEYREYLESRGIKTVLWGCSVEPSLIDEKMKYDLSRYNLITARESITYNALKSINQNVILAPDPAFALKKGTGIFPSGLQEKKYIGINVSPLIQGCELKVGITIDNYRGLIRNILENTNNSIALIPHVVWEHNDDRVPLKQLYEEFSDSKRIFMVEDQNCMQLKDVISKCEFFVGARTHSTIAAYSTCVPTLVVGYSVKARGIAKDLFGTEEGYVLPVQSLKTPDDLKNVFNTLYKNRINIRKHLERVIPEYITGIQNAKEAVEAL